MHVEIQEMGKHGEVLWGKYEWSVLHLQTSCEAAKILFALAVFEDRGQGEEEREG